MHYKGIIIYKTAFHSKTAILDENNTMQHVFMDGKKLLSIGSYIVYTKKQKGDVAFGECVSIEDLPLAIAKENIYFLHHIFEIIYAFTPVGKTIHGLFDHVLFLYHQPTNFYVEDALWKKLFIGKILFLLSIYKEEQKSIISFFHKINTLPIDRVTIESLHLAEEEALNNWLLTIFDMHQKLNKFKTTYFRAHCGKI
ncbi:hypothetical protein EKK58_04245 [Candidatus Dependentiae bacterium]|nr:MAG: hypothetical protein EKK58_04245 [Candidatus Dependentiae bacterium]